MNLGFSEKDRGVGGSSVAVPIARSVDGGFVSRYVRRWPLFNAALGKIF